jgi:hypothetical protein
MNQPLSGTTLPVTSTPDVKERWVWVDGLLDAAAMASS